MRALTFEIREQLFKINNEQFNAVNDIKSLVGYKLKNKLENCVEQYRNDIHCAYAKYIYAMSSFSPITHIVSNPYENLRKMNASQEFAKSFSTLMEKIDYQVKAVLKVQIEMSIEELKVMCKEFDNKKEQIAPNLFQHSDIVVLGNYTSTFAAIPPTVKFSSILIPESLKELFNGDIPLSKRVWNVFSGNKDAEINTETERAISHLKELVNKEISKALDSIFTPLLDTLTEQNRKLLANEQV